MGEPVPVVIMMFCLGALGDCSECLKYQDMQLTVITLLAAEIPDLELAEDEAT